MPQIGVSHSFRIVPEEALDEIPELLREFLDRFAKSGTTEGKFNEPSAVDTPSQWPEHKWKWEASGAIEPHT
jgi:hypothetical protein